MAQSQRTSFVSPKSNSKINHKIETFKQLDYTSQEITFTHRQQQKREGDGERMREKEPVLVLREKREEGSF